MTCVACEKTRNLGAVIISVLVILAIGCMDPDEYKPEGPPRRPIHPKDRVYYFLFRTRFFGVNTIVPYCLIGPA